jgi:hypothetical protein
MWPFTKSKLDTKLENRLIALEFDLEFCRQSTSANALALSAISKYINDKHSEDSSKLVPYTHTQVVEPIDTSIVLEKKLLEDALSSAVVKTDSLITKLKDQEDTIKRYEFIIESSNISIEKLENVNKVQFQTITAQSQTIDDLKEENKKLHSEIFQLQTTNDIALKKAKLEFEEQKYRDFTNMYSATIEMSKSTNIALVEMVVNKLKEMQTPTILMQNGTTPEVKSKQDSGYKSI